MMETNGLMYENNIEATFDHFREILYPVIVRSENYAVPPPLTFLLKTLHFSCVNCKGFHKHERLFMIMVQQVPKC